MKQRTGRFIGVVSALLLFLSAGATTNASAQGTGFTYQGRLQDSGANANGNYDFQFTLWDALTGGTQQPQPTPVTVTKSGVTVANFISHGFILRAGVFDTTILLWPRCPKTD
jgi:hypothetical protein